MNQDEAVDEVLAGFTPLGEDHPVAVETVEAVAAELAAREESREIARDRAQSFPRPFVLVRDVDETGVSGTGPVAEGVEFTDRTVALRWRGQWPTSVVFYDGGLVALLAVHGHNGRTRIVWSDEEA